MFVHVNAHCTGVDSISPTSFDFLLFVRRFCSADQQGVLTLAGFLAFKTGASILVVSTL